MIYLSLKEKKEKNGIINIIKELEIRDKLYDATDSEFYSFENFNKSKLIICDLSEENVRDCLNIKKPVIVFKRKNKGLNDKEKRLLSKTNVYTYNSKVELREILNNIIKQQKKNKLIVLITSILILCLLILWFILILNQISVNKNKDKTDVIDNKQEQDISNEKVDYKSENIVLYGDSITDFYDVDNFFGDKPIINSGISGNGVDDLYRDLKDRVYRYNPTKVFILIGTNDLYRYDDDYISNKIKDIVKLINDNRPNAKIYVESIYPVNNNRDNDIVIGETVKDRNNKRISTLNIKIKNICNGKNVKCEYIDMYNELTDENGDLKLEYTVDGLHITDKGYEIITNKLMEYIDPNIKKEKDSKN